ncbi:MAG: T9SS type A sorting domain-containing protein, partial [Ignavibacteriae bacterium]|nr:T9SS type A sorting domain-containing protein [Ignavibacteriota bacterium]
MPQSFPLLAVYPNPFNPTTTIKYQVPEVRSQRSDVLGHWSSVSLRVYDVLGREVATLVNEVKEPGEYSVQWDAEGLASGVYVCRMKAGDFVATRKLILSK